MNLLYHGGNSDMNIKEIIRKYKLPLATKGVQVNPTLGIVEFTKNVVHKVYPDANVMYINNKIKIYVGDDTDIIVNDGYWILAIPVKSLVGLHILSSLQMNRVWNLEF